MISHDYTTKGKFDFVRGCQPSLSQVWCSPVLQKWRYNVGLFSCDITCPYDQRDMWLCKWNLLSLCHHCLKVNGYSSYTSGDKTFYLAKWHPITMWAKGYVTLLWEAPRLKSPDAYRSCGRCNVFILSCDITWSQIQRNIWSGKWNKLNLRHRCVKSDAYKSSVNRCITFYFVTWHCVSAWLKA